MCDQKHYIYGKKAIIESFNNKVVINTIYCLKTPTDILEIYPQVRIEIVTSAFFEKFKDVNHQNMVALTDQKISFLTIDSMIQKYKEEAKTTILILDEINDARNLGAIMRTASAFKVNAIILKKDNQAPINDLSIKTSIGAAYNLDFVIVSNLNNTVEKLKNNGWWIYATSLSKNSQSVEQCKFDNKSVIILGNEDKGISHLLIERSDFIIKICMDSIVQSLNVSVAAGIILHKNYQKY